MILRRVGCKIHSQLFVGTVKRVGYYMKQNISEQVKAIALPIAKKLGYEIWDVEYGKVGADYHLCITIDKEDGITIDDCEKFHREIDAELDRVDPIENSYTLEVSSPGLERELKTEAHYKAMVNWDVKLKFFAPLDTSFGSAAGKKEIDATLLGYEDGYVLLKSNDENIKIPHKLISKANTIFEF